MARRPTSKHALPHFSAALYMQAVQSPKDYIALYTQVFEWVNEHGRLANTDLSRVAKHCASIIKLEAEAVLLSHLPVEQRLVYPMLEARERKAMRMVSRTHADAAVEARRYKRIARHIFKPLFWNNTVVAERERERIARVMLERATASTAKEIGAQSLADVVQKIDHA